LAQESHTSPYAIESLKIDPGKLCPISDKRIPNTLNALKKLAPIKAVKKLSCNDLLPDESPGCKAEEISYAGMKIVAAAFPKSLWVADLEISDAEHNYLGSTLGIGSLISTVESTYGIKIDKSKSPVVLQGECVPLSVWHTNGRISKVKLTCSAC
jgi:hypothetical protein